jgi:predicted CoA-substrate-specific enzyme activase
MSRTAVQTLLKGHPLTGRVAVTGGVAANPGMIHYLRKTLESGCEGEATVEVLVSPQSAVCAAIGAAIDGPAVAIGPAVDRLTAPQAGRAAAPAAITRRPALELRKSTFPDFTVPMSWVDDEGNEVRVHAGLAARAGKRTARATPDVRALVGIDVGSTSTKAALCDDGGTVLADVYRRTLGDPVGAGKKLLAAIRDIEKRLRIRFDVTAVGTTGSGRRIVGAIAGADTIVNEISAHVRGAVSVDPTVTTILEIGGQDSKYMRVANGLCVDANMNYVCAAGTGTFVEELGRKLGFGLEEIGTQAMGAEPPHTSDRCTVFMEQDAFALTREGAPRREVMAAILYSVIENYRAKVVGNRPVDRRKVMFQGATARNPGLVAAIENVFDVEVVVSPYCHVMGSIGAALLAADHLAARGGRTTFRGLDLADREVGVTTDTCELCSNRCVISSAHIDGVDETPSFGYLCGREPSETRMRKNEEYVPFRARKKMLRERSEPRIGDPRRPRVGVPMALSTWGYAPLFKTLIEELGAEPVFSPVTDREVARLGAAKVGSDFCFPVKVAHGHVAAMLGRDDLAAVFVPSMIEEERHPHASRSRFCPYLQVLHAVVKPMFDERPTGPAMVAPVLDWNLPPAEVGKYIAIAFAGILDVEPEAAGRAFVAARAAQRDFQDAIVARGREVRQALKRDGKKGIVIIGRPYNTLDPVVSLNLPLKVSEAGFTVIPMDMIEFHPERLGVSSENLYWHYGQKILSAVKEVADDPDLYAIFLTSFNCGPDSFILTHAEATMGDKPFLVLELDEHGSDGGYATRIEAFLDVVKGRGVERARHRELTSCKAGPEDLKGRILWIPPMHPYGARLFPYIFRGHGIESECLPQSDGESLAMGRTATRGSECTPMALTLGSFLKSVRDSGLPPERHALFMPNATGPCRFGAYAQVQHMALERLGLGSIPILSPSSENSYLGIPNTARKALWHAILCGDFLLKLVLARRPYEVEKGACDAMAATWLERIGAMFEQRRDPKPALLAAAHAFETIAARRHPRPLVGVVGEIYARCDPFANSFALKAIEEGGGEAWLAPISEWILYTVWIARQHRDFRGEGFFERLASEMSNVFIERREHEYIELMRPFLPDRLEPSIAEVAEAGMPYVPHEFEGESILTVGRTVRFFEQGADLVLNVAPFGCMHGHVSGSLFERISQKYDRPIVTTFYDATGAANQTMRSFIQAAHRRREREAAPSAPCA